MSSRFFPSVLQQVENMVETIAITIIKNKKQKNGTEKVDELVPKVYTIYLVYIIPHGIYYVIELLQCNWSVHVYVCAIRFFCVRLTRFFAKWTAFWLLNLTWTAEHLFERVFYNFNNGPKKKFFFLIRFLFFLTRNKCVRFSLQKAKRKFCKCVANMFLLWYLD